MAFPNAYLETDEPSKRGTVLTLASLSLIIFGLGMVVADPILLAYVAYYRAAPVLPLIGDVLDGTTPIGIAGGLNAVLVLGVPLVAVSALDVLAGFWLWRSTKRGGKLGIAIQPLNLFFAYGFGIPGLFVLAPLWLLLIALGWKGLR
jgi:hypothetical protein